MRVLGRSEAAIHPPVLECQPASNRRSRPLRRRVGAACRLWRGVGRPCRRLRWRLRKPRDNQLVRTRLRSCWCDVRFERRLHGCRARPFRLRRSWRALGQRARSVRPGNRRRPLYAGREAATRPRRRPYGRRAAKCCIPAVLGRRRWRRRSGRMGRRARRQRGGAAEPLDAAMRFERRLHWGRRGQRLRRRPPGRRRGDRALLWRPCGRGAAQPPGGFDRRARRLRRSSRSSRRPLHDERRTRLRGRPHRGRGRRSVLLGRRQCRPWGHRMRRLWRRLRWRRAARHPDAAVRFERRLPGRRARRLQRSPRRPRRPLGRRAGCKCCGARPLYMAATRLCRRPCWRRAAWSRISVLLGRRQRRGDRMRPPRSSAQLRRRGLSEPWGGAARLLGGRSGACPRPRRHAVLGRTQCRGRPAGARWRPRPRRLLRRRPRRPDGDLRRCMASLRQLPRESRGWRRGLRAGHRLRRCQRRNRRLPLCRRPWPFRCVKRRLRRPQLRRLRGRRPKHGT